MTAVLDAERRFATRRRTRRRQSMRRRIVRPALVVAIVVTVVGGAIWAAWSSPLLAVQNITVKGTSRLSRADILAAAKVPLGGSMLRLDPGRIRARVAALPAVAAVTIDRDWPHRLVITVTERQAVAVTPTAGGAELVDATGVAFTTAVDAPAGLLKLQLGAAVPGPGDPDAKAALAVWKTLPSALRAAVVSIAAPSPSDVTLQLGNHRTIVWGDPTQAARKLVVLRALMAHPARTYDVSTPDVPVTTS